MVALIKVNFVIKREVKRNFEVFLSIWDGVNIEKRKRRIMEGRFALISPIH